MALQNVHIKEMKLALSSDAKPRLKWTQELHQRFLNAVDRLGGAEKATPKSLMRVMGIDGLTLYHLKSHLQKYRMGKSQQLQTHTHNKEEDYGEKQRTHFTSKICDGAKEHINDLQISRALQIQMEVQRKLHEQIEVQRHLQLRIESQGKYLQSVLRKAQETLSQYTCCSIEVGQAKAQLSQLLSMVGSECPNSSFSALTQSGEGSMSKDEKNEHKFLKRNGCSLESSLTSSESSLRNEETPTHHEAYENYNQENGKSKIEERNSILLSLMEMHPVGNGGSKRKRSESAIDDDDEINHIEISTSRKLELLENTDLNI